MASYLISRPLQLRQLVDAQHKQLLAERPGDLAAALAGVVWPRTPPASHTHAALLLGMMDDCFQALMESEVASAAEAAVNALPKQLTRDAAATAAAAAQSLHPRLQKLRDLLDKAGGALKGLPLRMLITPLLRPLLAPLGLPLPPPSLLQLKEVSAGAAGTAAKGGALLPPQGGANVLDPELGAIVYEAQVGGEWGEEGGGEVERGRRNEVQWGW